MKVIFIKDLKNQGKKGEVKEVADGYAKNFLIKNGYAVMETNTSMDILKKDKEKERATIEKDTFEANVIKDKLEKDKLVFIVKVGDKGRVFGSISSKQIHEELIKKDYQIDKKKIVLKDPIQALGTHNVEIELYKNVTATLKVELVSR